MSTADPADRLILRGALSTGAGFLVRFGARFLFLFAAGQLYGPLLFGAFALALALVEASIGLGGLAMKKMLFQMLDEQGGQRPGARAFHVVLDAFLLVLLTSLALAGLFMAAALVLPPSLIAPATATALFWLAPMIAVQGLIDVLLSATRWTHKIRYEVVGRSMVEPYALLFGVASAWMLGFRETGLIIGYWFASAMIGLYALAGVRTCFGSFGLSQYRPEARRLWATFRWLLPNTGTDVVTGIFTRIDLLLVGMFLGERWAGIYGMAQQLRTPIKHVRQSFDGLLVPLVTRTLASSGPAATRDALASASRFILVVQMPFVIGILAIGLPLLELFGPGFGAGYVALLLLVTAEALHGAFGLGDLLFVYLKPRIGFRIAAASSLFGAAAAVMLIPAWGIEGAAMSVLLAYALQAWLRRRVLKSSLGVAVPVAHSALPLAAGAAGAAAVLLLLRWGDATPDLWALATLLAGLAAYGAVLASWLRITGQTLSIQGFRTGASASRSS